MLYGAIVATNLEQAISLETKIMQLADTVADVEPPADMLKNFIERTKAKSWRSSAPSSRRSRR